MWWAPPRAILYADARVMLKQIIEEKWFEARGVVGFWPAAADGDDVVVYADESRETELARLHTLRQQMTPRRRQAQRRPVRLRWPPVGGPGRLYQAPSAVTAGHGEPRGRPARFKAAGERL